MRILVLGGTVFLGRDIVGCALQRGHDVTLFNRGQSNPGLFPGVETIRGDRERDLDRLTGRSWEAVIDTSGYLPRIVSASARALSGAAPHYTFISTISVYERLPDPGADEHTPVEALPPGASEDVLAHYGPLKALCEEEVRGAYGDRSLVIRPGLIVGPWDPTDRFTYWAVRVSEGGEVLAPGSPHRQVQLIDARDLAAWTLELVERGARGTFNATGPTARLTMSGLLEACVRASGSDARLTWVGEDFLLERAVAPWSEMPLWLPESNANARGMLGVSIERALSEGLSFRPLEETAADTLAWHREQRGARHQWVAGMARGREVELLTEWHHQLKPGHPSPKA
jgi:2'-hydroxyisoflavone reductase